MATADVHEPQFTVKLDFRGQHLARGITQWSIDSDWLSPSDRFSFTWVSENPEEDFKNLRMQPVTLSIDGNQQLLGDIETIERTSFNVVRCSGHDYIQNFVESTMGPHIRFNVTPDMTVREMVESAIPGIHFVEFADNAELDMVLVRTGSPAGRRANPAVEQLKVKQVTPETDDGVYEFFNRVLARFGVMMKPGDNRATIYLDTPNYQQDPRYKIICKINGGANNVIDATLVEDWSSTPTSLLVLGNVPRNGATREKAEAYISMIEYASEVTSGKFNIEDAVRHGKTVTDTPSDIVSYYRSVHIRDKDSKTPEQLVKVIRRALSEKLKDTYKYTVRVQGMRDPRTNSLYANNTIATVKDEIRGVDEDMWVCGHSFNWQSGAGATTELMCYRKGLITL